MGNDNGHALVRENLIRAVQPGGFELRAEAGDEDAPLRFVSRFAVYNQWTEIRSLFEGHFMERFAPGAFKKTMRERFNRIRVTLNHGMDPSLGDRPIVDLEDLRDEDAGPVGEGRVLDGLPEMVVDGLRSGVYGASHRFSVVRELVDQEPEKSATNPDGIPEHTITEARLYEFGPVTFAAYEGATAGVRSITDDARRFTLAELGEELKGDEAERHRVLAQLVKVAGDVPDLSRYLEVQTDPDSNLTEREQEQVAPSTADAAREGTSAPERREPVTGNLYGLDGADQDERPSWAL